MTEYPGMRFFRSRYAIAVIAGLLLAVAFPLPGVAGLAWIAPGLLAAAALGKPGGECFRIGYVGGFAYYAASLYWLLLIPYRWHGLPLGPALGLVALSAYLALYPAAWVWLVHQARTAQAVRGTSQGETAGPLGILWVGNWGQRALWALFGAAAWVGLEMVTARLFSGFPWNLLGASQYKLVPLIQLASVTGVYGVSFLVVWTSLSLVSAGLMLIQHPGRRAGLAGEILVPSLAIAFLFNSGLSQIRRDIPPGRSLRVTLIQPSIPQTLIWDQTADEERFAQLLKVCERALTNQTDLLVWPEAAVPKLLRYDQPTLDAVTGLARNHGVWMIIGADDAEPSKDTTGARKTDYFNSSFLISPEGVLKERYVKQSLVIFGEYIPLQKWLPFLKFFTPVESGFTPGTSPVPFEMPNLNATASVLICFEDVFPGVARKAATTNVDFLVNLTNDGWFGESSAPWQHAISAVFRAVENGLPLVRCANNGLTCWVDHRGRIRQLFRDRADTVYGRGYLTFDLPLPGKDTDSAAPRTFYHRHGDVFGWGCLAWTGLSTARLLVRFRRERVKNQQN